MMTEKELFEYKKDCNVFIGIDPDCDKSGFAYVERSNHTIESSSLSFYDLYRYLSNTRYDKRVVMIEGGWLNQGNWHIGSYRVTPAKAAAIGRHVGMNHQTGILLSQLCENLDIPYEVVKPLPKHWAGPNGKITAEELEYFTGYSKRTNQDERDAILLAWTYAGLPVRVKPIEGWCYGKG